VGSLTISNPIPPQACTKEVSQEFSTAIAAAVVLPPATISTIFPLSMLIKATA